MRNPLINPRNGWTWLAGIVVTVVIGQVVLEIVSGRFLDWSTWEWVWYPLIFALSVAVVVVAVPKIRIPKLRRGAGGTKPTVEKLNDIESAPALIVFVSTNPNGAFRTLIAQFAEAPDSLLRHVFLVHSKQSKQVAEDLYEDINGDETKGYKAHKDGLLADFSDLHDMYRVSRIAVANAVAQVDNPGDVVIDVTGGTAVASAGAVLAGQRIDGVTLTYIPPGPTGGLGDTIRRVDVKIVPEDGEDGTGPDDSAS